MCRSVWVSVCVFVHLMTLQEHIRTQEAAGLRHTMEIRETKDIRESLADLHICTKPPRITFHKNCGSNIPCCDLFLLSFNRKLTGKSCKLDSELDA